MPRLGTAELMDFSYSFPHHDLRKAVKALEDSFGVTNCGHCGKDFYRTYFVVCGECLTKASKIARGLPEN